MIEQTCTELTRAGRRCTHPTAEVVADPRYGERGVCAQHAKDYPTNQRRVYIPGLNHD